MINEISRLLVSWSKTLLKQPGDPVRELTTTERLYLYVF